jgi:hypothetical protein
VSVVCRIRVSGDPPCPPIAPTPLPSILGSNCQRGRSPRNQHEPTFRFLTHPRFSIQSFVLQGISEGVDRMSCRGGLVRCVSGARAERCGSRLRGLRMSGSSRVERFRSIVEISSTLPSNAVIPYSSPSKRRYHNAPPNPRLFRLVSNHQHGVCILRDLTVHHPRSSRATHRIRAPSVFRRIIPIKYRVYSRCKGETMVYYIHTYG